MTRCPEESSREGQKVLALKGSGGLFLQCYFVFGEIQ